MAKSKIINSKTLYKYVIKQNNTYLNCIKIQDKNVIIFINNNSVEKIKKAIEKYGDVLDTAISPK